MYLFTTVPFLYFINTRLKGKIQKISWIFVYFIPNIFLYFYITDFDISFSNILLMTISILLVNYIYENGYIQNDIILTKKEKNPNLRVDGSLLLKLRKNIFKIFLIRGIVIIILVVGIYLVENDFLILTKYILILFLIQILYLIYNSIRNIGNLYLILPLSYLRFYGYLLPLVETVQLFEFIIITIFIYPLLKMLEFTKQERYNFDTLARIIKNVDLFRIKYYSILLLVSLFCILYLDTPKYFILLVIYYFLFRIATFLIISKSVTVKKELLKYTKDIYRKEKE